MLQLHFKLFIWLPRWVVNYVNLHFAVFLACRYNYNFIFGNIGISCLCRSINSFNAELQLFVNFLLNEKSDVTVALCHFILQMLESNGLIVIFGYTFFEGCLSFLTLIESDKVLFSVRGNLTAIHDPLNWVVWVQAI